VPEQFGDGLDADQRDPLPLLDGERVPGGLDLDQRPFPGRPGVEVGLEVEGAGLVPGQLGREPPEVRRLGCAFGAVPEVLGAEEVVLADGDPDTPFEVFAGVEDREDEAAAEEVVLAADDAAFGFEDVGGVFCQKAGAGAL